MLAYQIFGVLRIEEDTNISFPSNPRREPDPELLDPRPPEAPPEVPPSKPPRDPGVFIQNDPFDWREKDRAGGPEAAALGTLRLLNMQGTGDSVLIQIETETSKKWYKVGDAFESYELLSVDVEAGTAEVFDESINRARIIEMER